MNELLYFEIPAQGLISKGRQLIDSNFDLRFVTRGFGLALYFGLDWSLLCLDLILDTWFILNCSWLVNTSLKMKNNMVGVRIKELLVIDEELQI
jgi:hypothetical protein